MGKGQVPAQTSPAGKKTAGTQAPADVDAKPDKKRVEFRGKPPYEICVPEGFDFTKYKMLKRGVFKTEALFFEHRAAECEFRAEHWRSRATESSAMGDKAQRAKAKRLIRLQAKYDELREQLVEQGVDVEAIEKMMEKEAKE